MKITPTPNVLCGLAAALFCLFACAEAVSTYAPDQSTIASANLPDIWEWKAPKVSPESAIAEPIKMWLLDDGDVLVYYSWLTKTTSGRPKLNRVLETFFLRRTADPKANDQLLISKSGTVLLSDGQSLGALLRSEYTGAILADGSTLSSACVGTRDCYWGPARCNFVRREHIPVGSSVTPKIIQARVLFRLPERPERWQGATNNCPGEPEKELQLRVANVSGSILPLSDGGFLIADPAGGSVIRFDAQFESRSTTLGRRYFVFDNLRLDALFVPQLTGENYDRDEESIRFQAAIDALYAFLKRLQKGGGQ